MEHTRSLYIGGRWVAPRSGRFLPVINPATERDIAELAVGSSEDVDLAVAAARRAFSTISLSVAERLALLDSIIDEYRAQADALAEVICSDVGAPLWLARKAHVPGGLANLVAARDVLAGFRSEEVEGSYVVAKEPIGVCGLITPWNWPLSQIATKVAPALAAGCAVVLKPSEVAPLSALLFTEIVDRAGTPPGLFNVVHGLGSEVGAALSAHPEVDMVSFTGSTRAGVEIARAAAPMVKRVVQELGGKSANIVLDDADLETVIPRDLWAVCMNSGQSCNAPTRMLVPEHQMGAAAEIAAAAAAELVVGDPRSDATKIGPVVSHTQMQRVEGLIQRGIDEGANVVAGGVGRPAGQSTGYYVRPTVFAHASNDMDVARDEIFGPVLVMIGYDGDDDAVAKANDSRYGLSGYVSGSPERCRSIASRLRCGQVHINGARADITAPFGGYKQSGNGRDHGRLGFEEYLEVKATFEA